MQAGREGVRFPFLFDFFLFFSASFGLRSSEYGPGRLRRDAWVYVHVTFWCQGTSTTCGKSSLTHFNGSGLEDEEVVQTKLVPTMGGKFGPVDVLERHPLASHAALQQQLFFSSSAAMATVQILCFRDGFLTDGSSTPAACRGHFWAGRRQ